MLHISISPKEKRIIEFYITSSSTGGCKINIQALAISMSSILRVGGSLDNIKCAFRGIGACPSYSTRRAKNEKVSKGVSCPTAILNALLEVQEQLKNDTLDELQLLGFYGNKESIEIKEDNVMTIDLNKPMFVEEELKFKQEYGDVSFAQRFNKCPQCGNKIEHVGGCIQCMDCGFTKCE